MQSLLSVLQNFQPPQSLFFLPGNRDFLFAPLWKNQDAIIAQLKQNSEDASKSMNNNIAQTIELTLQPLADMVNQGYPQPEIQQEIQNLFQIQSQALDITKKISQVSSTETPIPKELTAEDLDNLKQEFNNFLPDYRRDTEEWKFQELFSKLQPMSAKAEELRAKYPDDPDLIKINDLFNEVKLLTKAWDYAIEGAASLPGKTVILFPKKAKPISGTVLSYEESKITIKKEQGTEVIALQELAPRSIRTLALRNVEKNDRNAEPYLALSAFFYITKDENECIEAIEAAQKLEASLASVERYQKWASGVIEEKKRRFEQRTQLGSDEQRLAEQKQEEQRLAKLRQDAWALVRQLLIEYRHNRCDVVLQYLCTLKTKIGDKPGGRDELIKIHYDIKKTEGHSLSTIASNCYYNCPFCRNSAEFKCRECKGEGFIQEPDRWIDKEIKIEGKKKFCTTCNGKGIVDCPYCREKRKNPNYIMIKDYYSQF